MSAISSELLDQLGLSRPELGRAQEEKRNHLGQSEFLKLMTVQLANQDPFSPMENGDFIGQMAQFSTVTGLESLTQSFGSLAQTLSQGQALQAASLVGREVLVPTEFGHLNEGGTIQGALELPNSATSARVEVVDSSGQLVRIIALDNTAAGLQPFQWDGLNEDGDEAPPGIYQFRATVQGGQGSTAVETFLNARVDSVAIDPDGGLELSVQGLGPIQFSDVRRIS